MRDGLKHVLIVSHFFPPMGGGGVQRITKFVKYLEPCGWRATIVCGRPEDYWMRDDSLLAELPASARVVRVAGASGLGLLRRLRGGTTTQGSTRSSRGFGLLRRATSWFLVPDSYVGWRPFALRAARAVLHDDPPQALLSTGPPETNHLVGLALRRTAGLPWLADFRDPWFALHLHPAPTPWHRARHARLERSVLSGADAVVATTLWLRDLLRQRTPHPPERLVVIRNGFDPADFPPAAAPAPDPERPMRLVHTGMLTLTRSANGLLRGLHVLLGRRPDVRGRIRIELIGTRESANDGLVRELGVDDHVRLGGYVPHRDAVAAMQGADVLVLIKHTEARFVGLIPGKLYEYLGAGRPILALVPESEAADLVRRLGCGEVVAPEDPEAIARTLEVLYDAHRAGQLGARYACGDTRAFQRSEQARNLAALLEQISAAAAHRAPAGEPA
jgi:glycosyltransferase involved in cell wall biosynthesis